MSARYRPRRLVLAAAAVLSLAAPLTVAGSWGQTAAAASLTTAWHNGAFSINTGGVVSRSDGSWQAETDGAALCARNAA